MKLPALFKSFILLDVLASASVASLSAQSAFSSDPVAYYTELLAAYNNDPIQAMQVADPAYAATFDEPRLIEVFGAERQWMTEGDKLRLKQAGLAFMDVTDFEDIEVDRSFVSAEKSWPEIQRQDKVNKVISLLSVDAMREDLVTLTSFYNRFYRSDYGVKSSRWIFDQVLQIVASAPPSTRLSIETFTHSFPQSSIIARFEPSGGRSSPSPKHPRDVLPRIILARTRTRPTTSSRCSRRRALMTTARARSRFSPPSARSLRLDSPPRLRSSFTGTQRRKEVC